MIAQKLGNLAALVSPATCRGTIAELGMRLLEDSVADVRQASYKSCGSILRRLCQGERDDREQFLTYIKKLATSTNYQVRQMFVYIAQEVPIPSRRDRTQCPCWGGCNSGACLLLLLC